MLRAVVRVALRNVPLTRLMGRSAVGIEATAAAASGQLRALDIRRVRACRWGRPEGDARQERARRQALTGTGENCGAG